MIPFEGLTLWPGLLSLEARGLGLKAPGVAAACSLQSLYFGTSSQSLMLHSRMLEAGRRVRE